MTQFFASLQRKELAMKLNTPVLMPLLKRLVVLIAKYAKCLIVGEMSVSGLKSSENI